MRLRRTRGLIHLLLGCSLLASCGGGASEYGEAAAGLAVGVAATAGHRAVTGECWGRCSPGYACNRESGLCERGDCDPPCATGMHCALTATGTECRATALVPEPLY